MQKEFGGWCVMQVEVHCWFRNPKLVEYCRQTDVHITAYSPTGGNPDYSGPRPWEDEVVKSIAKKYSRTVQQVPLAFHCQPGNLETRKWMLISALHQKLSCAKHQQPHPSSAHPVLLPHVAAMKQPGKCNKPSTANACTIPLANPFSM